MTRDITFAILRTSVMTEEQIKILDNESPVTDIQDLAKIYSLMDGQKVILLPSQQYDDYYVFCGIANKDIDREISYLFEQDSTLGNLLSRPTWAARGYHKSRENVSDKATTGIPALTLSYSGAGA